MPTVSNEPKPEEERRIINILPKYDKICKEDFSTFEDKKFCLKNRAKLKIILKREKTLIAKIIGKVSKKCIYKISVKHSKGEIITILHKNEMYSFPKT